MVSNLIRKSVNVLSLKQNNVLSAAVVIMITVLLSAFLGLIRIRLLSNFFGDTRTLDVYWAAFRLPDMLFQLLVMGALSSAFIPVFSSYLAKEGKKTAMNIANTAITVSVIIYAFLFLFIFLFTKNLCQAIAPGFSSSEIELMINLTRIMMFGQVFFIIGNFITGILQSFHRFLLPALAPLFYNLGIILCTIFLSSNIGIYGPTYGVVLGTLFFLIIQLPLVISLGWSYKPSFNIFHHGVKEIGKLMFPRTLALGVAQIEYTTDLIIASLFAPGHYTIFTFALFLISLPIRLFGATIGQASLPSLSLIYAKSDYHEFKKTLIISFNQMIYLILPASIIILVLRIPLVRLAFGSSSFSWEATILTGRVVAFLTLAIICQSLTQLFIRAFYALHDTKTPLIIGAISVVLNVIASVFFALILNMGVQGLAISTSISSFVNAILLIIFLQSRLGNPDFETFISLGKKIAATSIMALSLYFLMRLLDLFVFDTTKTINLIFLTFLTLIFGMGSYLAASKLLNIEETDSYFQVLKKIRNWKNIVASNKEIIESASPVPQS